MKEIRTEIIINAYPEKVWEVLMDFGSYAVWNPFIQSIAGEHGVRAQLVVRIHPPGGKSMIFKPVVLKYEQNREFRWKGKLLIRGLFDGEHYFILKANNDGTTTFIHGERFSGLLVGLLTDALRKTKLGFEAMNNALKSVCDKSSPSFKPSNLI